MCWLMGTARGEEAEAALHGPRLRSLQEKLVDSPARGLVYEAAGSVDPALLAAGAAIVREVGETFRMPVAVVAEDPPTRAPGPRRWCGGVSSVLEA